MFYLYTHHLCVRLEPQIARTVTRYIFTYGNMLDTSAIFLSVLQHPEIRELTLVGGRAEHNQKYWGYDLHDAEVLY